MASTAATIKTRLAGVLFLTLGCCLAALAVVGLFGTFTPVADSNAQIDARLQVLAGKADNPAELQNLLHLQEEALAAKPSEPYGWARLSYLRWMTGAESRDAFAALRMSDFVSPFEPRQLPERAVAWLRFRQVETLEERLYQDTLWQKAVALWDDETWALTSRLEITDYVGKALDHKDKDLAKAWRERIDDAQDIAEAKKEGKTETKTDAKAPIVRREPTDLPDIDDDKPDPDDRPDPDDKP
jgi:hypothetical protein